MRLTLVVTMAVGVAVAGCSGSSGGSDSSGSSTDSAAVAVVVDRYGDCLTAIGDSLDGQVLPSSTDEHTHVGFGPKSVVFSVTKAGDKTYVTPLDVKSTRTLGKGGDTC